MYEYVLAFVLGAIITMVIDVSWWRIDYKKAEKGMEAHEHYHIGLELIIVGIWSMLVHPTIVYGLAGAGLFFFVAEWLQNVEVLHSKGIVKPGHQFAIGSPHFKQSTIIGIILAGVVISSYIMVTLWV